MKFFVFAFAIVASLMGPASAAARVLSTEQELEYARARLEEILAGSGFALLPGSLTLEPVLLKSTMNLIWNNTGAYFFNEDLDRAYRVRFILDNGPSRIAGGVYLVTEEVCGSVNGSRREILSHSLGKNVCAYISKGLLPWQKWRDVSVQDLIQF